ncbi:MAG: carboxypeptidase regulatory-like domain-containing protein, partial [bacterium]|nr:carboxypeptidase regulatory-like domain-containing protein [bacterium]
FELDIRVDGYLPERRSVTISDHDVDLGDILMVNKGLKITGTVVDKSGKPLANVHIYAYGSIAQQDPNSSPLHFVSNDSISDEEGHFQWSGIQPNAQFSIHISSQRSTKELQKAGPFSTDADLGAIVVTPELK